MACKRVATIYYRAPTSVTEKLRCSQLVVFNDKRARKFNKYRREKDTEDYDRDIYRYEVRQSIDLFQDADSLERNSVVHGKCSRFRSPTSSML